MRSHLIHTTISVIFLFIVIYGCSFREDVPLEKKMADDYCNCLQMVDDVKLKAEYYFDSCNQVSIDKNFDGIVVEFFDDVVLEDDSLKLRELGTEFYTEKVIPLMKKECEIVKKLQEEGILY